MNIIISNDDGVHAPGLHELASSLAKVANVKVVAPDRDRSAASNSLSIDVPLRRVKLDNGFEQVNGTPTDCVHLAITGWYKEWADMVVSGINAGSNLGDDVIYSGTVAAATEGRYLGLPAIAVSLSSPKGEFKNFATAGSVILQLLERMQETPLPADTILNVNVPDRPLSEVKGLKVTRLGYRHMSEPAIKSEDPRGLPIFWIGPPGKEQESGPDTDFQAVKEGYVSITPLHIDLTSYATLESIRDWTKNWTLNP